MFVIQLKVQCQNKHCLSWSRVKPACCNQESIPGYESDLTRKTSSKGSDSSQSNSPVSGRSVVLLPSPSTSSSSSSSSTTSSSMYQQPLEMKTLEGGGESRNVEHLAGSAAHNAPASYSVCHPPAERPDTRDNGKKVAVARPEEFVKTEIFIDHPLDGHAPANLGGEQRREEKEEEEEEKGEQRDLSLESITTTNGTISTSRGAPASSWGESRLVTQPDFQIGTRSTPLASQQLPIHPPVILDPSKGDSDSMEEAANKTDEEKLTSISPMSDEDKLTAIFLCTDSDIPTEPSAGDLESTSKKDERVPPSPDNQSAESCDEKQLAPKKDIWGLGGEMGNGSSNEELADQGVSLPNSLPPPLETEKDLAENQDVSVAEEAGEEELGRDDDSIEYPATSGDTSTPPPDVGEEKKEEDCDYEGEEVASEKEQELPFSDVGLQSPASSSSTTNRLQQPDTENVTSLQVEWTKEEEEEVEEMLTPFGRGLVHDDAGRPMAQPQRALARSEDPQVIPEAHFYFL